MTALTQPPAPAYARLAVTLLAAGFDRSNRISRRISAVNTIAGAFLCLPCAVAVIVCVGRLRACRVPRFPVGQPACTVTTLNRLTAIRGDSSNLGVSQMSNTAQGASAPSLLSRHIAAAHRRMAIAALRADSSVSVRLTRYNAHMTKARALVGGAA